MEKQIEQTTKHASDLNFFLGVLSRAEQYFFPSKGSQPGKNELVAGG